MKLYKNTLLALLASISLNASSASESSNENSGCCSNSDDLSTDEAGRSCNPRGNYGYELTGSFGEALLTPFREVGVFTFDGIGNATARGTTVLSGSVIQRPVYVCTYAFANRLGEAQCSRTDTVTGLTTPFNFALAHGDCCNEIQLLALPIPATVFAVVSISGHAVK